MQIFTATNAYALIRLGGKNVTNNSIWHRWKPVTLSELKAYLVMLLKMALVEKPEVKYYFNRHWTEYCPFFLDVFFRRRFLQIHWILHVQPPRPTVGPVTRGSKMSNVIKYVQQKCLENFTPRQNIAVDESTVGFRGRISFKTFNPQKPTKRGLRVYVLSNSASGYIFSFEPYLGKPTTENLPFPAMPFITHIVLHLVNQVLNKAQEAGFHVYTDRFYTSCILATQLQQQQQVHLTGTIQKNRVGLEMKRLRLRNHNLKVYRHEDDMMSLAKAELSWQD